MSQNRDWRVILKEIEEEKNSKNDSLELGDSWRAMPHRIEGATNKTNGLYRRSALPAQSVNNLYNFIIEKQPTNGKKATDSVKDAPVTQPLKLLIPNVQAITPKSDKSSDSMDFSKFLSEPTDGHKAVTSTPYPVRQTDANKSPRGTMNVQRNVADSPNKLFVPAPTRIPISTPRTSRLPSDADRRAKQPSDRKKMPSPTSVVSSTVHIVSDDEESGAAKSPEQQIRAPSNRILAVTEDADQNRPSIDEDQQKQDAGTNNADEAVFRRPDVVRRPLVKPIKLELDDDQSKMSNSQRNKKPKSMMNPLLESYIKVGESINNRTNSIPLENSSSSSRRRLYKKGDSCNEEDILKDVVPLEQPSFVLNPVSAGDNGTFTKAKSISAQSNAVEGDTNTGSDAIVETAVQDPKATDEPQPQAKESAAPPQSGTEQNNIINRTFDCEPEYLSPLSDDGDESTSDGQNQNAISNESESNDGGRKSLHAPAKSDAPSNDDVAESTNDVPSATANKKQVDDAENNLPKANSSDQQNHMSAKHSSKQVLAEILGDWSDTVKPTNDKDGVDPSMSNDSDSEVHSSDIKQPSTESKVRQARSQSKKSQNTGTASSKTRRRGAVRSDLKQIDEDRETDEDELSTTSAIVRNETRNASHAKKGNKRTGTQVSTKTKNESAHSAQQEVAEIEYSDSDGDEQIAEEPSIIKLPRTKKQQRDAAKSRSKKEDIETAGNEVALRSKSKRKPVANGSDTDTITTSKAREKKTRDEDDVLGTDDETEDVLPGKPKGRQTRQKDFNVEDDVIEADGRKTKLVATSKGKKTNADVKGTNVIDPELATTSKGKEKKKRKNAEEDEIEAEPATTSKGKEKKKRGNAEEDVPGEDGIETEPTTTSKRNRRNKRGNADDDVPEEVGIEAEPATTSKGKEKKKRGNAEEDVPEEYGIETEPTTTSKRNQRNKRGTTEDDVSDEDGIEAEPATTSKINQRKRRGNTENDVAEAVETESKLVKTSKGKEKRKRENSEEGVPEDDGIEAEPTFKGNQKKKKLGTVDDVAGTELAAASKSKGKKKRSNAEDEVTESDVNEAALPKTSQPKTRKKNLDAEDNTTEERDEPQIEIDDSPARVRSTPKPNVRKSQKRKHQSIADARSQSNDQRGNFSSRIDGSMATKRRKLSRWERKRESHCFYNSLKPREVVPGVRQSTRERRMPTSNLLFAVPISANSSNRSALQRQNGRTVQPKMRLTQSANGDGENVFSMLLNGSMDKEPPLITNLDGIEITQGFHKTVKNNLVIHHIPGETGPSYGYFTLEPGMVKRPCRISWNLHIHVVSGPIHIFTNGKSEQMVTGSFASLHSGTKYSLRNDGENSALVFFSQQANEQPKID